MSEAELMEDAGSAPAKSSLPPRGAPVRFGDVTLDLDGCSLSNRDGGDIPLTRSEFPRCCEEFIHHPGRVLSRDYLLDALGGKRPDPFDRSIDMLVGRLRKKIEADPKQPRPDRHSGRRGLSLRRVDAVFVARSKNLLIAVQTSQDNGRPDGDPGSDPPSAERPAGLLGADGWSEGAYPGGASRQRQSRQARPRGARPPVEAAPSGAEPPHVATLPRRSCSGRGSKVPRADKAFSAPAVGDRDHSHS